MKRFVCLLLAAVTSLSAGQLFPSKLTLAESIAIRLSEQRIQQEMGLSTGQREDVDRQIRAHSSKQAAINAKMARAKDSEIGELNRQMESLETTTAKGIVASLNIGQRERLLQIALQDAGPFALRSTVIAKRVGVTDSQAKQIEAIATRTLAELNVLSEQVGRQIDSIPAGRSGEAKRQAIAKTYTSKSEQIEVKGANLVLATLSISQRKKWQAILGKPFKL